MKRFKGLGCLSLLCLGLFLGSSKVQAEQYEYDSFDRVTKVIYEDGSYVSYEYDNNGNITKTEVHDERRLHVGTPAISSVKSAENGVEVKWGAVEYAEKYRVYRKEGTGKWVKQADVIGTSYQDETAVSGVTYAYTVRCVTADGKTFTSDYDKTGKSILYLAQPVISKVSIVETGVTVTWNAVPGADQYRIFRKEGDGSWKKLADVNTLQYLDTAVTGGKTYGYTVRCINGEGSSYDKEGKSITFMTMPKLASVANDLTGVTLKWDAVAGAEKYRVYRKDAGGSYKRLEDVTGTSFTDETAVSGNDYIYTIRVVSADGKNLLGIYDKEGTGIHYVAAPEIVSVANTFAGVMVKWNAVTGADSYRVYRKVKGGSWKKLIDVTTANYTDKEAQSGVTYCYTVRCMNAAGEFVSAYDKNGTQYTRLDAPDLISVSITKSGYVRVSWKQVEGATGYTVYRKETGGKWLKLRDIDDPAKLYFLDGTAESGKTYYYTIRSMGEDITGCYNTTGLKIVP